jgi:serine/threonine protein kinase
MLSPSLPRSLTGALSQAIMTEEEIFAKALDLEANQRDQFLGEACQGDEALHARIRELLPLHESDDAFLDTPPDPVMSTVLRESVGASKTKGDRAQDKMAPSLGVVGNYILEKEIDRGAMGIVYRARQNKLNRTVALKMIRPSLIASEKDAKRFHVEATALAKLDHPNIVAIYEAGEVEGRHYFSMQLIEGANLFERMNSFQGNPKAAVKLIVAVARAVDAVHHLGILHRDIKPGNILIGDDGTPYITDFGLAKDTQNDQNLTAIGEVLGTPSYMAPEQAQRGTKHVTRAADVYALGAVLYELLTGRPPHKADTILDTLHLVETAKPAPPRSLNPEIDKGLENIVLKSLARNPRRRFSSAGGLADALEHWHQDESPLFRELTFFVRNNRLLAGAFLIGTLAVLGLVIWLALLVSRLTILLQ